MQLKTFFPLFLSQDFLYCFDLHKKHEKLKKQLKNAEKSQSSKPGVFDEKDFGIGAQILHDLDIFNLKLISNSEVIKKRVGMTGYGLKITDRISY